MRVALDQTAVRALRLHSPAPLLAPRTGRHLPSAACALPAEQRGRGPQPGSPQPGLARRGGPSPARPARCRAPARSAPRRRLCIFKPRCRIPLSPITRRAAPGGQWRAPPRFFKPSVSSNRRPARLAPPSRRSPHPNRFQRVCGLPTPSRATYPGSCSAADASGAASQWGARPARAGGAAGSLNRCGSQWAAAGGGPGGAAGQVAVAGRAAENKRL